MYLGPHRPYRPIRNYYFDRVRPGVPDGNQLQEYRYRYQGVDYPGVLGLMRARNLNHDNVYGARVYARPRAGRHMDREDRRRLNRFRLLRYRMPFHRNRNNPRWRRYYRNPDSPHQIVPEHVSPNYADTDGIVAHRQRNYLTNVNRQNRLVNALIVTTNRAAAVQERNRLRNLPDLLRRQRQDQIDDRTRANLRNYDANIADRM